MFKVKIVLAGPCQAGKTTLANFLSDATENAIPPSYRPTHVLRILEFEAGGLNVNNQMAKADVELWDTSGNHGFSSSWTAITRDTHGIIFVMDPENAQHARELEAFYEEFASKAGVGASQCIVFANVKAGGKGLRGIQLPSQFNRVPQMEVNIEEEGNRVRNDFSNFLATLISNLSERHNQEEMNIMNMR